MKLSEAMREGAKKRPQGKRFFAAFENGQVCTCALGAAIEAVTGISPEFIVRGDWLKIDTREVLSRLGFRRWESPSDRGPYANHPVTQTFDSVYEIITDLNDEKSWSRERIADWLEGIGM